MNTTLSNNFRVRILVYPEAEVLDYAGPFQVFTTASRISKYSFDVAFVAESKSPVVTRGGLTLMPHLSLNQAQPTDIFIVSGGWHNDAQKNSILIKGIQAIAKECKILASVCTGAFLLAEAGLLEGKTITTHWEDVEEFKQQFPSISVDAQARWVDEGSLISSAGISAGIDMSLHLLARLTDTSTARATARQMDYYWNQNSH